MKTENASLPEIKKSYRNLAKLWHPDRNKNSAESVSKFKLISEAYEILSNNRTREDYDEQLKYGNMTINGHPYSNPMDMFNKINKSTFLDLCFQLLQIFEL